tara:strand:- start:1677 stop:2588 length:912 start_codon:yes stop_codon:yes gene_type:complete
MRKKKIIIGSRGSKLALIYANKVKNQLNKIFQNIIDIKAIKTSGDENQKDRLSEIGGKGLFSKKIEIELLEKRIDLAVHALKDMPSIETDGLITNCYLKRNFPNEVLISKNNLTLDKLKSNSIIGTSSFRREYQLKHRRNDLIYKLIRGNVDTRINKMKEGLYDAIILSKAGIDNLNLSKYISQEFSVDEIIPSVGQGIIAIQCRYDDEEMINYLNKINHEQTNICATTEREVLKILEGDCDTAIGAFSFIKGNKINLIAELFSVDGKNKYNFKAENKLHLAKELGQKVGNFLKKKSEGNYKR